MPPPSPTAPQKQQGPNTLRRILRQALFGPYLELELHFVGGSIALRFQHTSWPKYRVSYWGVCSSLSRRLLRAQRPPNGPQQPPNAVSGAVQVPIGSGSRPRRLAALYEHLGVFVSDGWLRGHSALISPRIRGTKFWVVPASW